MFHLFALADTLVAVETVSADTLVAVETVSLCFVFHPFVPPDRLVSVDSGKEK